MALSERKVQMKVWNNFGERMKVWNELANMWDDRYQPPLNDLTCLWVLYSRFVRKKHYSGMKVWI